MRKVAVPLHCKETWTHLWVSVHLIWSLLGHTCGMHLPLHLHDRLNVLQRARDALVHNACMVWYCMVYDFQEQACQVHALVRLHSHACMEHASCSSE